MTPRGLRARSALAFALLALVLSVTLSTVTYQLARWYLLGQRESLATRQVTLNALVVRGILAAGDTGPDEALSSLRSGSNARPVLWFDDNWYAPIVELNESKITPSMLDAVDQGGAHRQRLEVNGTPYVLIGVSLPGLDAEYYEFVGVSEYQRTLETLGTVLVAAATATTLAGAIAGWLASKRLLRPLADVAQAAQAMSEGDLSRRLEVDHDPDLQPVADSFNEMASSLEARIERELRFTADVSHELRTPLTAMGSAVSLAQRGGLTGRAEFAVGVLAEQVDHFRRLTLELLEISRIDAGAVELDLQPTDVVELTRRVVSELGGDSAIVVTQLGGRAEQRVDPVRFERMVSNLVENADRYAGGATAVTLRLDDDSLVLEVDDAGPGVPEAERIAVFGRFHRGTAESPHDRPKGTGLGLSLVEEHARLHGGTVHIDQSPAGGARFVVTLPVGAT
jgi:two-component system sensor histidine kinase MtrB